MARLIHLNGMPGIGKSTLARRYVGDHPGVLNCDIDVLRTLIGGWSHDFAAAGALIRPAALAMIEAYLAEGCDVVLPQMLLDPVQVARFEACATRTGADFLERVLTDEADRAVARFDRRGAAEPDDPWHDQVRGIVAAQGGAAALRDHHARLQDLLRHRPTAVVIESVEDEMEATYQRLLASLAR